MKETLADFPGCLAEAFEPLELLHTGCLSLLYRVRPREPEDSPTELLRWFPRCTQARRQAKILEQVQTLAGLEIPGMVRFLGAGTTPEGPYARMEEVQGLQVTDPKSPLSPLQVARGLAEILQGMHDQGLIHGDVRLENLRVEPTGRLVLLGPNLGMEARRMPGGVPREGDPEPTGFPQYLSPQMHFMKRAASEDDWFAWAVLVWYLVEGSPPFGNEELSRSARLQKLGRVRPARIPAGAPLSDAIRGCLVLVPQDRAKTIARLPELLNQATCPGPPGEYQEIPRLPLPERVQRSARDPDKASEKQPTKPFGKSAILVLLLVLGGLLSLMSAIL